jgi:ribosomal protein S18 acetylase RimI-like enzyme
VNEAARESKEREVRPKRPRSQETVLRVRRIHRRDLNRVWEFLKLCFRDVNRETVEYQRPRSKRRFLEVYEESGVAQLLFEAQTGTRVEMVGYAECAFEILGTDNWMNERYFAKRDMRPLFVEELAVHPNYQGRGIGAFILDQLEHMARVRGCTHLVLEVAENNKGALSFYRARSFMKLDAAIFLAKRVANEPELLSPRALHPKKETSPDGAAIPASARRSKASGENKAAGDASAPRKSPPQKRSSGASTRASAPPPADE